MSNKQDKENAKPGAKPAKKQKKTPLTLEELCKKCTPENRHDYIDFGRKGRELL